MVIFIDESGTHKQTGNASIFLVYVEIADLEEFEKGIEENIKKIMIDSRKPKWYSLKLKKVLRDKGISVKKVITVRKDESSPGIRVSDCLAGLFRNSSQKAKMIQSPHENRQK